MSNYVTTASSLADELNRRRDNTEAIRSARDRFVERTFGIGHYQTLLNRHLPPARARPFGVLARQVASMNVEDIACFIACPFLALEPLTLTFGRDTYTSENHDKRSRVHVPWVWHSRKGHMVVDVHYVARERPLRLEHRILRCIQTTMGLPLLMFHESLRGNVLGARQWICDVSALKAEEFWSAQKKPATAYQNVHGFDRRTDVSSLSGAEDVRSPASWYYPLYLSWFLDGTMALLETYNNSESAVSEAKGVFEQAMREIEREVGWKPLVVEIPPLSKDMLLLNRHLLEKPDAVASIRESTDLNGDSTAAFCRRIAERVIGYR